MIYQKEIVLPSYGRGFHLITNKITEAFLELPKQGLMHIFVQHTSAGITINENADRTVREDFETVFNILVKENESYYKHTFEGPDDMPAHIKTSLVGNSVTIPIADYKLKLGTWQGIYYCEFRNEPQKRKIFVSVWS